MSPEDRTDDERRAVSHPAAAGHSRDHSGPEPTVRESGGFIEGLFGRGLLYVAVTSLPLATATLVSPVLARVLGPSEFGLLASSIALHQVLMALALFGLDQVIVLVRTERRGDRDARVLITAGTALSVGLTVLAGTTAGAWSGPLGFHNGGSLVTATVLWTIPTTLATLALAVLMAEDRLLGFALVSVLLEIGSQFVGLAVLLGSGGSDVAVYAWGAGAGRLLAMIAAVILVRPLRISAHSRPVLLDAMRLGLPIMLSGLSTFVLNSADRLIIQAIAGSAEAGRYQIAYTIGEAAIIVVVSTGQVWAARFAEVRDDLLRRRLLGRSRDHLYELMAPTMLGVNLLAPVLLRIFAPPSFAPADLTGVVFLVSIGGFPVIATLSSSRALIIQRRTVPVALAAGLAAAVNVGLNVLLVPSEGLGGAAVATVLAFVVQAVVQRVAFRPFRGWPRPAPMAVLAVLLAVALSGAFVLVDQSPFWIAVRCGLAILAGAWALLAYLRIRSGGKPV